MFFLAERLFAFLWLMVAIVVLLVSGCATNTNNQPNKFAYLAKSDIDTVADIHLRHSTTLLKSLSVKLYRRNPLYCKMHGGLLDNCIKLSLSRNLAYRRAKVGSCKGSQCIEQGLDTDFTGDRVLAVLVGMQDMLDAAYNHKKEFFLTDELEPQKLYNLARNLEITVWRLANRRDAYGNRYILTDTINDETRNLSYERLFGKLISLQDTLADIIAERDNRRIKNVIQSLASAVFLPI